VNSPETKDFMEVGMKLIKLSIVFSPRLVLPPSANVQHDYPFYAIRDHLGNTRLTFTDKNGNGVVDVTNTASNEILQENHFYPFGLDMAGPWMNDAALDNQYKYNGKEYNGDFGLNWMDYGARWYDASVGRWWWVDPMVEKYSNYSPYNYTLNNPVRFIDPNGKQVGVDTVLGGGKDGRDLIRITVSGKLINMSSKKDMDMADFLNYLGTCRK
jgi:RHS repeat-associated protein